MQASHPVRSATARQCSAVLPSASLLFRPPSSKLGRHPTGAVAVLAKFTAEAAVATGLQCRVSAGRARLTLHPGRVLEMGWQPPGLIASSPPTPRVTWCVNDFQLPGSARVEGRLGGEHRDPEEGWGWWPIGLAEPSRVVGTRRDETGDDHSRSPIPGWTFGVP